ncbi:MAG TPA: response regulator transcription factor [Candidatus Limnocylindria bacterium]
MSRVAGERVLVVDDDPTIREVIGRTLHRHGYDVVMTATVTEALEAERRRRPDLIILDLGLPDGEGTEVIDAVRAHRPTPIIVLSVRGRERDKVDALDRGADDYLTKPFGIDELLARIRATLRRVQRRPSGAEVIGAGPLRLDLPKRRVTVAGEGVELTPTEYELLLALAEADGGVVTTRRLLQRVWGPEYGSEAHYVHVYAARLRSKLGAAHDRLTTEPGVGYRLEVDPT